VTRAQLRLSLDKSLVCIVEVRFDIDVAQSVVSRSALAETSSFIIRINSASSPSLSNSSSAAVYLFMFIWRLLALKCLEGLLQLFLPEDSLVVLRAAVSCREAVPHFKRV
jgi:hypothetical protein